MEQKSVLIGMSGGVDSSVAAALLKEQGYHVIGATMRLWTYSDSCNMKHEGCCAESAVEDARRVCDKLGIDFYVMNFKDMFKDKVVDYFVDEYIHGRTPNPCIACNKYLKFDALLKKALAMGIDYVATGHYAKIEKGEDGKYILRASEAVKKDQSYVLWSLTQEQLKHVQFPLGGMEKCEVRALAEAHNFINARKHDSQDICFVQNGSYADFIEQYTGKTYPPGDFVDTDGNVLGQHRGVIRYTIGQRKGLGLALPAPLYVKSVDIEKNTVTLSPESELFKKELTASGINLISVAEIKELMHIKAKVRYRQPEQWATVTQTGPDSLKVVFDEPQRAITCGQSVVLYDGDRVLGGGTIDSVE